MNVEIDTIKTKIKNLKKSNKEMNDLLIESLKLFKIISVKNGPMKHEAYAMCQKITTFEENNS